MAEYFRCLIAGAEASMYPCAAAFWRNPHDKCSLLSVHYNYTLHYVFSRLQSAAISPRRNPCELYFVSFLSDEVPGVRFTDDWGRPKWGYSKHWLVIIQSAVTDSQRNLAQATPAMLSWHVLIFIVTELTEFQIQVIKWWSNFKLGHLSYLLLKLCWFNQPRGGHCWNVFNRWTILQSASFKAIKATEKAGDMSDIRDVSTFTHNRGRVFVQMAPVFWDTAW